jgi:phosphate starvation-inducible protein PhoH
MGRPRKVTPELEKATNARAVKKTLTKEELLASIKLSIKCKNETQKKLINTIKDNDVTICTGPAGTGKAQPLDSLILTPNGYVKMVNIKIDDEVIGIDGTPIKVNGVYPQGEKDIYLVTFSDGTTTECCGEHLWLTQTYKERNYKKKVKTDDGVKTKISERGKKGSVRNTIEIMNTLTVGIKSKKTNHSIPMVEPIEFIKKDVNIHPYLLGCLLGDGGFTTANITFTSADDDIIEEIKKILPLNHVIEEKYKHNYNIKSIGVKKNDISEFLKEVNLFGLKSDDKFIPEEYLINNIETRLEILRGLMDTDGSVDKKSGTPLFYSTSEKLIKGVTFIVQSLGGVVTKKEKIGRYKKLNGEVKECKTIYTLHINLPFNFVPFKLKRKIRLLKERTKYTPIRYIKNIEKIGKKEAQCISVNDNNHLYLTNDCIVTHNTFISCHQSITELKYNNLINKIVIVKSVTTLKNEEIGFLKGSLEEKMEPFIYSFIKNFEKIIGSELTNKLKDEKIIEVLPIAYMRGINIDNAIVIIDEVQNISIDNIRTILTRLGENSKMVLLGDINQIDIKYKKDSALEFLLDNFKNTSGIGVVEFNNSEIIRHPLIIKIEEVFNSYDKSKTQNNVNNFNVKKNIKIQKKPNWLKLLFNKIFGR